MRYNDITYIHLNIAYCTNTQTQAFIHAKTFVSFFVVVIVVASCSRYVSTFDDDDIAMCWKRQ